MSDGANLVSVEYGETTPGRETGRDGAGLAPRIAGDAAQAAAGAADFGGLYDRYYRRVFSYVMRTLMNREAAEDVTSEAFFRAYRRFSSFQPQRGSFSSWIYRIATNAMRDHFRRNRNTVAFEAGDDALERILARRSEAASATEQLERMETYRDLHREIQELPPLYRIVLVLFYFESKSIREISQILGALVPTVKWRLHQARRQLARRLNQTRRDEQ